MSQRTVKLKATPFHTLKSGPMTLRQDKSSEPRLERIHQNTSIRLVTQTTRITARRALQTESQQRSQIENSLDLYRCRCEESKHDESIVCYPHEAANRLPQSWH